MHFVIITDRVFSQNSTSTSAPVKKIVHFDDRKLGKVQKVHLQSKVKNIEKTF